MLSNLFRSVALVGVLAAAPLAVAAPTPQFDLWQVEDGEDFDAMKTEIEKVLAELLVWDEQRQAFRVKEGYGEGLPVPPQMIEGLLGRFLENDGGAPRIQDNGQFRQVLPMLRRFMEQGRGELERLEKMTPEEREKAMERLQGMGRMLQNPKARDGMKRLGKMFAERAIPTPQATPEKAPAPSRPVQKAPAGSLEERIEQLERRVAELEGRLEGERGSGRRRRRMRGLPGVALIRDMLRGFARLGAIMEPEDWQRVSQTLSKAMGELSMDDLQDQGQLLLKLQALLEPDDFERFMEIASDFLESDEGQAFELRVEEIVSGVEDFMNSERGRELEERARDLMERLQGLGERGGFGAELQERIERMLGDRSKDRGRMTQERRLY